MLHAVQSNQSACTSKPSLAVDSNCPVLLILRKFQELVDDVVWRRGAVQKVKVVVPNFLFDELLSIILRFVKSNDRRHVHLLKDGHIVFRSKRAVLICDVKWA